MNNIDLFEGLIKYHIESNLMAGLKNEEINDGVMYFQENGEKIPAKIGEENGQPWYQSLLLFANGSNIADKLKDADIIPANTPLVFKPIKDENEFYRFLNSLTRKDNAIIYDRNAGRITKVRLNNHSPSLERIVIEDILPPNFLSEDGSVPFYDENGWSNVGNKADISVTLSRGFYDKKANHNHVDGFLIRSTIYNSLGFGPVVHVYKDGMRMFFFKHEDSKGPFIDPEHKIVGIYRNYKLKKEKFIQDSKDKMVYINKDSRLAYRNGRLVF